MQYHHVILYSTTLHHNGVFFVLFLQEFCANAILCANNITGFEKVLSFMGLTLRCINLLSASVNPLNLVVWGEIYISCKRILL